MGKINLPAPVSESVISIDSVDINQGVINKSSGFEIKDLIELKTPEEVNFTDEAIKLISLKTHLGIKSSDLSIDKTLNKILELAKESGIKNKHELYVRLKELSYKTGLSEPKEQIKKIYHFMKLDMQIKNLVNKQEILYGN